MHTAMHWTIKQQRCWFAMSVWFLTLTVQGVCAQPPEESADSTDEPVLVLQNAIVHHMTGAAPCVSTVIVKQGRIDAVGVNLDIPPDARVYDLKGCHLIPGLIDSRCATWLTSAATTEANAKAELNIVDALDPWNEDWQELAAQGITATYAQPSALSSLGGYGAVLRVAPSHDRSKIVLKNEVAIQAAIGTRGNSSKDRYAQIQALKKLLEGAKKKTKKKEDDKKKDSKSNDDASPSKKDIDDDDDSDRKAKPASDSKEEIEKDVDVSKRRLRRLLNKEVPLFVEVHHRDALQRILELANELEVRLVLNGLSHGNICKDLIDEMEHPMIVGPLLEPATAPNYRKDAQFEWLSDWATTDRVWALSSFSNSPRGAQILRVQAAQALKLGISHESVLKALTINAARILGVSDVLGSIAVGKRADIAVFAGAPLDPSSPTKMVLSGGEITYQRDVVTMEAREANASPLPQRLPSQYVVKTSRLLRNGVFSAGCLTVQDGKILAVNEDLPENELPVYDVVDAAITPGMVMAHTMLGQASTIVDNTESDMSHLRAVDAIDPTHTLAKQALADGFIHIGVSPGKNNTSAGAVGHLRLGSIEYVADAIIANQFVLTSDARKTDRFPSSLNGQIQLITRLMNGQPSDSSLYVSSALSRSLAAEKLANVQAVKSGDRIAIVAAESKLEIRSALQLAKEFQLKTTLLSSGRVGELAPQLAEAGMSLIVPAFGGNEYNANLRQIIEADRAGIAIAFAGNSANRIRMTAALLVQSGLPAKTALKGLTSGGGSIIGMKQIGLDARAPADFVVWDDHPLNFAAQPLNVVVDGHNVLKK